MKPFKEVIDGIRKAVMASEVREDIAQMGEYVEQFANTAAENIQKAIDTTLTLSGKAADAKATGDAVGQLKEDLGYYDKSVEWEKGEINVTTGVNVDRDYKIRTTKMLTIGDLIDITADSDYQFRVEMYDSDGSFIKTAQQSGMISGITREKIIQYAPSAKNIRIVLMQKNNYNSIDISASEHVRIYKMRENIIVKDGVEKNKLEIESTQKWFYDEIKLDWFSGQVNTTTGLDQVYPSRIHTSYAKIDRILRAEVKDNTYSIRADYYDTAYNYLGTTTDYVKSIIIKEDASMKPTAKYVRFSFRKDNVYDDMDISASENVRIIGATELVPDNEKIKCASLGVDAIRQYNTFATIAYSTIGIKPINSEAHFLYCAQKDFTHLKCDVQITSDNKIVLCHDNGYTLDDDGNIDYTFDPNNYIDIENMAYNEVVNLKFRSDTLTHPVGLDRYLSICRAYGKKPMITVRERSLDRIIPAVMEEVERFGMTGCTLINSFEISTLRAFRQKSPVIGLTQVLPFDQQINSTKVSQLQQIGAGVFLYFMDAVRGDRYAEKTSWIKEQRPFIDQIVKNGAMVMVAQIRYKDDLWLACNDGFAGAQTYSSFLYEP